MTAPRNVVLRGNCLDVMRTLPADSVDAVVTDPPYELGFMGKSWDSAGVSYDPATWAEALRVLKPGGHLLAFGGSRTYHRIAVAIEDAGFEIRDSLMWIYGSGFPKSLDVSKAMDKKAGAKREIVGSKGLKSFSGTRAQHNHGRLGLDHRTFEEANALTAPATDEAKRWEGWGTALKPSHEPIVLARKPLIGTVAENVLAHGTGALNIDASRIEAGADYHELQVIQGISRAHKSGTAIYGAGRDLRIEATTFIPAAGRWPANTLWDEEAAAQLDASTPAQPSRFFYVAKPTKRERNAGGTTNTHPTVKPIALMRYLITLVTPPGGVVLDPFLGSGTTACAAVLEGFDYIGIEQTPEYADIAEGRIAHYEQEADNG